MKINAIQTVASATSALEDLIKVIKERNPPPHEDLGYFSDQKDLEDGVELLKQPSWLNIVDMAEVMAPTLAKFAAETDYSLDQPDFEMPDNSMFVKTLPPGISAETAEAVLRHYAHFEKAVILAGHLAFKELGYPDAQIRDHIVEIPICSEFFLSLDVSSTNDFEFETTSEVTKTHGYATEHAYTAFMDALLNDISEDAKKTFESNNAKTQE